MTQVNRLRVWTILFLAAAAFLMGYASEVAAQKAGKKKRVTRLPNYYAKVVSEEQRSKIYEIQIEYEPRLAKLREELKALVDERDSAIENVLTSEQREEVVRLREEAAARRRAAGTPTGKAPDAAEKSQKAKSKKAA